MSERADSGNAVNSRGAGSRGACDDADMSRRVREVIGAVVLVALAAGMVYFALAQNTGVTVVLLLIFFVLAALMAVAASRAKE